MEEIRNIRLFLSAKIKEIDGVLKQKNLSPEVAANFRKSKMDLIRSRRDLVSKYKDKKRNLLESQCKRLVLELSDKSILESLTSFKEMPLSIVEIFDIPVKKKKGNKKL
jgi:hypothetical protein